MLSNKLERSFRSAYRLENMVIQTDVLAVNIGKWFFGLVGIHIAMIVGVYGGGKFFSFFGGPWCTLGGGVGRKRERGR